MTVRLLGVDVERRRLRATRPRRRPSGGCSRRSSALAERHGRPVRLLVVPAHDVFDAIVATILRLRSSDVHVGESSTLSADEQARLLGEAWEKARRARTARRPARRPPPQRTDRHLSSRRPPAVALARRSRSHPSRLARRHEGHRTARPPSRRRQGGAHANGTTTERPAARRGARRHSPDGPAGRRAGRRPPRPRLRAAARHDAQSPRGRCGDAADGAQPRGPGGGVPRAAAQGCRRRLRVSVAGRQGSAPQGDGQGRRRGAAQQHGARRPHDVPRRTARDRDARAADAAHARGARGRGDAARLPGAIRSAG